MIAAVTVGFLGVAGLTGPMAGWVVYGAGMLGWVVAGAFAYFYLRSRSPEKLSAVGRVLAEDEEDLAEGKLTSDPMHATTTA
jgi:hypothetical protein